MWLGVSWLWGCTDLKRVLSSPCGLHTFSSHCSSAWIPVLELFFSFFFYCYIKNLEDWKYVSRGRKEKQEEQREVKRITEKKNTHAVWGSGNYEIVWDCGKVLSMRILNRNIFFFFLFFPYFFMTWFQVSLWDLIFGSLFFSFCPLLRNPGWAGWHVGCV